jgi:[ribosomal protein S18]-alanine N-acetyltransferase
MNNVMFTEQSFLECRKLIPELTEALAGFFTTLREAGDETHFHPHPLIPEEAERICNYSGRDLYYAMTESNEILGYGMLRGWDEGYAIPSLGIAMHPKVRGVGLGRVFMHFLHIAAKRRGAREVRLKVYPDNLRALRMYQYLGYRFEVGHSEQLVGSLEL